MIHNILIARLKGRREQRFLENGHMYSQFPIRYNHHQTHSFPMKLKSVIKIKKFTSSGVPKNEDSVVWVYFKVIKATFCDIKFYLGELHIVYLFNLTNKATYLMMGLTVKYRFLGNSAAFRIMVCRFRN